MTQDTVIDAFVAHLRTNGYPTLQINNRPDKKNSKTPDIDAIARPFAIEHTSIDTVANQRRDSKRFLRVVDGLRNEFDNSVPCRLNITILYEGVQTGQNWKEIKHAFRGWITNYAVRYPRQSRGLVETVNRSKRLKTVSYLKVATLRQTFLTDPAFCPLPPVF